MNEWMSRWINSHFGCPSKRMAIQSSWFLKVNFVYIFYFFPTLSASSCGSPLLTILLFFHSTRLFIWCGCLKQKLHFPVFPEARSSCVAGFCPFSKHLTFDPYSLSLFLLCLPLNLPYLPCCLERLMSGWSSIWGHEKRATWSIKLNEDWVPEVPEEQGSVLFTSILLHKKGTSFFKPLLF